MQATHGMDIGTQANAKMINPILKHSPDSEFACSTYDSKKAPIMTKGRRAS